jgi:formylglycine-generating enzyme required for sulfatase activity
VVKPEDQQPSAADLMGKVGRVDEPLPSSASPAASPADAAQPGGTGAPTLDPELQEILGLQDAATDSRGVPELRAKAEELMKTNQFFTPAAPNNAVYLLQQILKKDPGNEFGKKGLAEIGTKYANLAQMEIQAKRLAKAKDYIDKALVAQPDNLDYQDLARKLGASVRGGATEVSCPDDMVFVGAGPFPLGSLDPQKMYGEKAAMEVYVQAYCVDLYEYPNKAGQTPKAQVTFHEAQTICQTQGKRLCAEEEWEKACKGGGNLAFPYGTTWIDTACNTEDAQGADRRIAAAGAFPQCRTSEGVFDLSGNLKEWTSSLYAPGASEFTIRGGGYRSPGKAARCSVRESGNPTIKNTLTGFRCCKSMGQATK